MIDHPIESAMDYPVEGCLCANCEYARYFNALSPAEQRQELELMMKYAHDRDPADWELS